MAVVSWWRQPAGLGWARAARVRRLAAVATLSAVLGGTGMAAAQAMPAPVRLNPAPAAEVGTPVTGLVPVKPVKIPVHDGTRSAFKPTAVRWPSPGSGALALSVPAKGQSQSGRASTATVPVWAQALAPASGVYQGPSSVNVRMLSHAQAVGLGVSGLVFQVDGGAAGAGRVRVGVDTSSFAQVYGGNYGLRLRLVALPACALTTPQVAACRKQTPLASNLDAEGHSVSAVVDLGAPERASAMSLSTGVGFAQDNTTGAAVIGATDSTGEEGGAAGSYAATRLSASGTWSEGGDSGSFTYTYPITVPGASTSLTPNVSLSYDSGTVDGQTTTTAAQSSWIGDGWSMADSSIEMTTIPCDDSPEGIASTLSPVPLDACYAGQIATLSLNGSSTALVYVSSKTAGGVTTSTWKAASDNGEVITHVTPTSNSPFAAYSAAADHWIVTERSGTKYEFGLEHLPGWSNQPSTKSVDTEPVYSANPGDPCYSSSGFTSSVCTMAYKWHLDYAVDLHAAAMAYYYQQDSNYYGEDLGAHNVSYIRDSHLDHIDYGFLDGGAYGTVPDRVAFTASSRCVLTTCDPISATNAPSEYPDVPYDLMCTGSGCTAYGPAFFSTVRLTAITTYQNPGTGLAPVDSYTLVQGTPSVTDVTSPTLWLQSIQRTGSDSGGLGGTAPALPLTVFHGDQYQNRVDLSKYPALYRYRIDSITTELGATIGITYETPTACTATYVQAQTAASAGPSPGKWTPGFMRRWVSV